MFKLKYKNISRCIAMLVLPAMLLSTTLFAMNEKAQEAFENALKEANEGNWRRAAKQYKAATLYADNYVVKANASKKEAEAYRNAELYYKEFKCLKILVENAPEQIDFRKTIEREYEIANLYSDGYREHPYTWVPWIEDDDHAIEIYEAILKQSPYAEFTPDLLVKLGSMYLDKGNNTEAEKTYKKIIEFYPNSKITKTAYLDLAHLYLELARKGDGDGYNATEAKKILHEFIRKYPNAPEIDWAKDSLTQTYELGAKKLYKLAKYYDSRGNIMAAQRYIREILVNYPETETATYAEKMLRTLIEPQFTAPEPPEHGEDEEESKYRIIALPEGNTKETLIIPANSENKWLLPINKESIRQDKLLKTEYEGQI